MYWSSNHGCRAPQKILSNLPDGQAGPGRHKCAACAYKKGKEDLQSRTSLLGDFHKCSHGSVAPASILTKLIDSQAGPGRHKCVVCAYEEGRKSGSRTPEAWPRREQKGKSLAKTKTYKLKQKKNWWDRDLEHLKAIGDLGEALVIDFEKEKLLAHGLIDLANSVEHVSKTEGDHKGYDIKSFDINGIEIFIEVKATTTDSDTFFMSRNEYEVCLANLERYFIYRIYNLKMDACEWSLEVYSPPIIDQLNFLNNEFIVSPKEKSIEG